MIFFSLYLLLFNLSFASLSLAGTLTLDWQSPSVLLSEGWQVADNAPDLAFVDAPGTGFRVALPLGTTEFTYFGRTRPSGGLYLGCVDCNQPTRDPQVIDAAAIPADPELASPLFTATGLDPAVLHEFTLFNLPDARFSGTSQLTFDSIVANAPSVDNPIPIVFPGEPDVRTLPTGSTSLPGAAAPQPTPENRLPNPGSEAAEPNSAPETTQPAFIPSSPPARQPAETSAGSLPSVSAPASPSVTSSIPPQATPPPAQSSANPFDIALSTSNQPSPSTSSAVSISDSTSAPASTPTDSVLDSTITRSLFTETSLRTSPSSTLSEPDASATAVSAQGSGGRLSNTLIALIAILSIIGIISLIFGTIVIRRTQKTRREIRDSFRRDLEQGPLPSAAGTSSYTSGESSYYQSPSMTQATSLPLPLPPAARVSERSPADLMSPYPLSASTTAEPIRDSMMYGGPRTDSAVSENPPASLPSPEASYPQSDWRRAATVSVIHANTVRNEQPWMTRIPAAMTYPRDSLHDRGHLPYTTFER